MDGGRRFQDGDGLVQDGDGRFQDGGGRFQDGGGRFQDGGGAFGDGFAEDGAAALLTPAEDGAAGLTPAEAAHGRLHALLMEPAFQPVQEATGRIPLFGVAGAALLYTGALVGLKRGALPRAWMERPRLSRALAVLGGFLGGLQVGLWRMRAAYAAYDPTGERLVHLRRLLREASPRMRARSDDDAFTKR